MDTELSEGLGSAGSLGYRAPAGGQGHRGRVGCEDPCLDTLAVPAHGELYCRRLSMPFNCMQVWRRAMKQSQVRRVRTTPTFSLGQVLTERSAA